MAAKVFFSREITPEKVVELYKLTGAELTGKVAVKLHSGEEGNQNFLKPEFWKPMIEHVNGTVVECNTAYEGSRNTTDKPFGDTEETWLEQVFHGGSAGRGRPRFRAGHTEGEVYPEEIRGKEQCKL